ncbi:MAG: hypothetical protein RLZZ450_1257 [Pseudomonadota bacterium]|jgi:hypothetical protein
MALVQRFLVSALLTAALACSAQARAQDAGEFSLDDPAEGEDPKAPVAKSAKPAAGPERETLLGDEQALEEERAPQERFRETTDPHEDPNQRLLFFGAGWRFSRVPTWMLGAYHVEAGPAVSTPASFTAELAFRKNGFQVTPTVGFTKLNLKGPFQLKGDPIEDTEYLEGKFNFLNLTVALTWSTSFTDWFALEYGLEAGIGLLFGDLTRSEAYKDKSGAWHKCPAWASQSNSLFNPDFPGTPTREQRTYCDPPLGPSDEPPPRTNPSDEDGAQYGVKAKRGLFQGGVPNVIPILGPRLSLRFKPIHQVVLRIDVPLPQVPFGFQGGVAAQYGF